MQSRDPDFVTYLQVSKPFFQTLTSWIFSGHLYDPFNEFFVQLNPNVPHKKLGWDTPAGDIGFVGVNEFGSFGEAQDNNTAYMLWEKKYIFVKEMLPSFVSEVFGKKVTRLDDCIPDEGLTPYRAADLLDGQKHQLHSLQLSRLGMDVDPSSASTSRQR